MSPALVELLRFRPIADVRQSEDEDWEAWKALGAARGIMVETVLGLLMWAGLIWVIADWLR